MSDPFSLAGKTSSLFSLALAVVVMTPPSGSWEAWLIALRQGKSPLPMRPDGRNLSLPLPLWVDCHLSWSTDRPQSKTRLGLADEIVLVGNPKLCRGQLEDWAVE